MPVDVDVDTEDIRAVISRDPAGMMILDPQGIIRFANAAACSLLNKREEDLVGTHQGVPALDGQAVELEIPRAYGEKGVVELRCCKIRWITRSGYLVTIQDATERPRGDDAVRH